MEFELEYPCHAGFEERWFVLHATKAGPGSRAHIIVVHQDITARKLMENDRRSQSLLLAEVNVSVHTTDLSRIVTTWNADSVQQFGWMAEEAIDRTADCLMTARPGASEAEIAERVARGWHGDVMLIRKNGSMFPAHVSSRVVGDLAGAARAIIVATVAVSI